MKLNIAERDLKHNWHPYTQMKDCEEVPPIAIDWAEGIKLFDKEGNFYYDTISSWWCNVHGHCHPKITKAISEQAKKLDHVLFAGFTHEPAVELSERLISITPDNLTKVFYSDNGSTAVEVALKMSLQYWKNKGKAEKAGFISFDKGYHGDTIGAMSVSGPSAYSKPFEELLFGSVKVPTPDCYRCPSGRERGNCGVECLSKMEEALEAGAEKTAAVIVEPLLLGAAGMIIYPAKYLKGLSELCAKHNVHLILDEVATGFGRTGKMFACEHAAVEPDIMCVSKGITSGSLALSATLATDEIFSAFYDEYEKGKTFYHGHTYTANPISCAAACASIDLFKEENTLNRVSMISIMMESFLDVMAALPSVGDTRHIGAVGAIELVKNIETKEPFGPERRIGLEIYKAGLSRNLILRPLGDVIYFFLPLCVTKEELEDIFARSAETISMVLKTLTL